MIIETNLSEQAKAAVADPAIAAAYAASETLKTATMEVDVEQFLGLQAPECMINNPANMVVPGASAGDLMRKGLIAYSRFGQTIDFASQLPGGMVVFMGEEAVVPKGASPHVGKSMRRRYTDIWRNVDGAWKLSVRQATIVAIEDQPEQ